MFVFAGLYLRLMFATRLCAHVSYSMLDSLVSYMKTHISYIQTGSCHNKMIKYGTHLIVDDTHLTSIKRFIIHSNCL